MLGCWRWAPTTLASGKRLTAPPHCLAWHRLLRLGVLLCPGLFWQDLSSLFKFLWMRRTSPRWAQLAMRLCKLSSCPLPLRLLEHLFRASPLPCFFTIEMSISRKTFEKLLNISKETLEYKEEMGTASSAEEMQSFHHTCP